MDPNGVLAIWDFVSNSEACGFAALVGSSDSEPEPGDSKTAERLETAAERERQEVSQAAQEEVAQGKDGKGKKKFLDSS